MKSRTSVRFLLLVVQLLILKALLEWLGLRSLYLVDCLDLERLICIRQNLKNREVRISIALSYQRDWESRGEEDWPARESYSDDFCEHLCSFSLQILNLEDRVWRRNAWEGEIQSFFLWRRTDIREDIEKVSSSSLDQFADSLYSYTHPRIPSHSALNNDDSTQYSDGSNLDTQELVCRIHVYQFQSFPLDLSNGFPFLWLFHYCRLFVCAAVRKSNPKWRGEKR